MIFGAIAMLQGRFIEMCTSRAGETVEDSGGTIEDGQMEPGLFKIANKSPFNAVAVSDEEERKKMRDRRADEERALKSLGKPRSPARAAEISKLLTWLYDR